MVRRRLLTPRTGPSGRAANLHKLPPGTQRECPRSQLRSPHGVCVCVWGGGAQNEDPLPSLILLGKSSRGQRLPSPPPEPPCGSGVKVEAATWHHRMGALVASTAAAGRRGDAEEMSPEKHLQSSPPPPAWCPGPSRPKKASGAQRKAPASALPLDSGGDPPRSVPAPSTLPQPTARGRALC